MKSTTRNSAISFIGAAFGLVGLLSVPLGLPGWAMLPFYGVFVASIWTVVWLQRRDKRRSVVSSTPTSPTSVGQPIGIKVLSLFLLIVVTLSGVWWLPFTGVHLDFRLRVITSVVSCIFALVVYLLGWWYARRKA